MSVDGLIVPFRIDLFRHMTALSPSAVQSLMGQPWPELENGQPPFDM